MNPDRLFPTLQSREVIVLSCLANNTKEALNLRNAVHDVARKGDGDRMDVESYRPSVAKATLDNPPFGEFHDTVWETCRSPWQRGRKPLLVGLFELQVSFKTAS